jgi:hypothetical protein
VGLFVNPDNLNVGIGTTTPGQKMVVEGGLITSGNVGIGTTAPTQSLDVYGNMNVAGSISAGNMGMFRNRIINGDMRIDQRNNGNAVTIAFNTGTYVLDRFGTNFNFYTAGNATVQRVTDAPDGFNYSYKVIVGSTPFSGGTNPYTWGTYQFIEAYNLTDLQLGTINAQPFVLSFWFKANNAGEYAVTIIGFNVPNYSRYTTTFSVNANTWTFITKKISSTGALAGTWNKTTDSGLQVSIGCYGGAGGIAVGLNSWGQGNINSATCFAWPTIANASIQMTGVQVEKGTIATPFELRPYGVELQLCMRYYQIVHFTLYAYVANLQRFSGAIHEIPIFPMRIAPIYTILSSHSSNWTGGTPIAQANATYYARMSALTSPTVADGFWEGVVSLTSEL